ncbi:hypothetical protein [Parageobacillus thermoglucosidasius]|uniref:hypothetical protein n=1 Tax=Parageobacillus thermoglucosidasius TaxID=1426 RepID=UPI000B586154|nr:hypothetical protein [Parageobacillus thermoglucosidasius]OUM93593.1 MAG: hypothetical protein BAA00_06065 [Parageobacillus thermoglucosidasius]
MDFNHFHNTLVEKATAEVDNKFGTNYVLVVLQNRMSTDEVDFSLFSFEDLFYVDDILDTMMQDEDMNGNLTLDPSSPFAITLRLSQKISAIGKIPRNRPASRYLFI